MRNNIFREKLMMYFMKILGVGVVLIVMVACTSTQGKKVDVSNTTKIHSGVTTKADVIKTIGNPLRRNIAPNGTEVWYYTYSSATSTPGLSMFFLGAFGKQHVTRESQSITIMFTGDTVTSCRVTVASSDVSGNLIEIGSGTGQTGVTTSANCGDLPKGQYKKVSQ